MKLDLYTEKSTTSTVKLFLSIISKEGVKKTETVNYDKEGKVTGITNSSDSYTNSEYSIFSSEKLSGSLPKSQLEAKLDDFFCSDEEEGGYVFEQEENEFSHCEIAVVFSKDIYDSARELLEEKYIPSNTEINYVGEINLFTMLSPSIS